MGLANARDRAMRRVHARKIGLRRRAVYFDLLLALVQGSMSDGTSSCRACEVHPLDPS